MINSKLLVALLVGLGLLLTSACTSEDSETAEAEQNQAQPENIFENEFAKVVKVTFEPGQELGPHEGTDRLIYSLNDYSIEWIVNGESEGKKSWSEGDVHVHGEDTHSAINTGSAEAEWLAFILKSDVPEVEMQSLENDVTTLEGDFAEVIFDNELFRVTEVTLASGESIPSHDGINRIIYSLSDYTLSYQFEGQEVVERPFESGDAHWHTPGTHSMDNIGDTEARFLVVSYK